MKTYKRIYSKLERLGFTDKDIQVLNLKNENLKKAYFFKKGLREFNIFNILKKNIKIEIPKQIKIRETENEDNQIEIEISLRHSYTGSITVYGSTYSTHYIHINREFFETATDRQIREYIRENIDMESEDEPSDYDNDSSDVYWDSDYQTEIDDFSET
jgi:DNA gyrase/topoisomerase IV subunit B